MTVTRGRDARRVKLYAGPETLAHVPAATRAPHSAAVPTGFVHAVDPMQGLIGLCGIEVKRVMLNLPWDQARSYDRCPTCVREARALGVAA